MQLDQCVALAELESLLYIHAGTAGVAEAACVVDVDRTARACSNLFG